MKKAAMTFETIKGLSLDEMNMVKGGISTTPPTTCSCGRSGNKNSPIGILCDHCGVACVPVKSAF